MTPVTQDHEQKETLTVDVIVPGHDARGAATPLFSRTRKLLIARDGARCWLSGMTAEESGAPLEAHHHPVERCFAEMWNWPRFAEACKAGVWGPHAAAFDWDAFFVGAVTVNVPADPADPADPVPAYSFLKVADPYLFVDDMTVNGRLLAKQFHTGKDEGIHDLPLPIYLAQGWLVEGYKFSNVEIIHHEQ
jgi:hypothetical protein